MSKALTSWELDAEQIVEFRAGRQVAFEFRTTLKPGIAIIQLLTDRLRCGIFSINDPGGGHLVLPLFRNQSVRLALICKVNELELFGAEISNRKLEQLLRRQLFTAKKVVAPESLGNDEMTILYRVFPVRPR